MKGAIRFSLLMLGMIMAAACFDPSGAKTDCDYEVVFSQEDGTSVNLGTAEANCITCPSGGKSTLARSSVSEKEDGFYVRSHRSNTFFESTIGDLSATQFG